jgi:hypothetical protein
LNAARDAGHNRTPEEVSRRYTIYLIIVALGQWLTLALRRIPPGQELEEIAT